MNRDAFIALLSRLVADGILTEPAAHELVAQFDAGTLREWDLPFLPTPYAHDRHNEEAALALLLLLLSRDKLTRLPTRTARHFSDALQDDYQAAVTKLAQKYDNGGMNLKRWQRLMGDGIAIHTIAQTMLGSGVSNLSPDQLDQLTETMNVQAAYLQRFADHMAYNNGVGQPYSEAQIAHRSIGYGGVGRAAFYLMSEQGNDEGAGWVVDYISRDDKGTCFPCLDAESNGPYLPGEGPFPGSVCRGGGLCRCRRETVYNPEAYARLTGR